MERDFEAHTWNNTKIRSLRILKEETRVASGKNAKLIFEEFQTWIILDIHNR